MSLEQRRAKNALDAVRALPQDDEVRRLYRAYVDRLGAAIVINGLGQALASERASAGGESGKPQTRAHTLVAQNLGRWLTDGEDGVYEANADALDSIVRNSADLYLRAQAEALAWLDWHKKFCRAELPRGEVGDG